jgi:hypothetical protein
MCEVHKPEKWPPISPGTRIRTKEPNEALKREWSVEGWKSKRPHALGTVVKHHDDGHGLFYDVLHDDGSIGHYDPSELEVSS